MLSARVERLLRVVGDPRLGLALLLLAGMANASAAAIPQTRGWLDAPPYLLLVGAILLSGVASFAVRSPAVWREWRRPSRLLPGAGLEWRTELDTAPEPRQRDAIASKLRGAGYRIIQREAPDGWALHGTRRGWARFAGLASHLALVLLVVGAAIGTAFSEETVFGLFPGEQSLLAAPRPGLTSSVRFDAFDADFGANGRPTRLDTHVTFVRDGRAVRSAVLRVNEPGDFDGYLVHGWTYGPAARVRITDLAGRPLADTPVALGGSPTSGRPPFVELPTLGLTIGLDLADAETNEVRITAAGGSGLIDSALLRPGETARIGSLTVELVELTAYVTFFSRSDPGMFALLAGASLLTLSLAIAFWLPRRRLTLELSGTKLRLAVRGERFDEPQAELLRQSRAINSILGLGAPGPQTQPISKAEPT